MTAILRFLRRFARSGADPQREREVVLDVEDEVRSATLYLPQLEVGRCPAWILLQGVTVPGRHHAGVRRMARSLAEAGHLALAPEVPSWTALQVDPRRTEPTVRSAIRFLTDCPRVDSRRVGLIGFSVAGTWCLEAAATELGRLLRAVVSVGGYGDFRRMALAMVVGEHEWQGRRRCYSPDPYGRWILGADLVPKLPDSLYGSREERMIAARGLRRLAETAGRHGALAGTPVYDDLIRQLRKRVPSSARLAWDLLAATSERLVPDPAAGRSLAGALAEAGLRDYPELDPSGRLGGLEVPSIVLHGRSDPLIPFTETLRLASLLPTRARRAVAITGFLGHAKLGQSVPLNPVALAGEVRRLLKAINRMLQSVEG